ncbi:MAG: hypothetical protein A2252_01180 [Elusimicrobia bacterium RIFOXYA2_FULL_39_19]|nr:MAG: hypothetical protein A2252_01180 [Elusimicrobia bacterium RIFOXYA2_FULL_39_19]
MKKGILRIIIGLFAISFLFGCNRDKAFVDKVLDAGDVDRSKGIELKWGDKLVIDENIFLKNFDFFYHDFSDKSVSISKIRDYIKENQYQNTIKKTTLTTYRISLGYFLLGTKMIQDGGYTNQEMLDVFNKAIDVGEGCNKDAYYGRGIIYFRLGDKEKYTKDFYKAREHHSRMSMNVFPTK